MYAVNNSNAYFYATVNQGYSITINGSSDSGTTATLSTTTNGSAALISHSVWVAYTGNKSITISGAANMSNIFCNNTALGNRSVSGTAPLDKIGSIPPVPTVSAPSTSTISETATSITVSWAKSSDYSGAATYTVQVSKNGGNYTTIKSGIANGTTSYAYTITAGQGNTYIFRVCAVNDIGSSNYSYSGTVTTNSISAPTIGTIATYNPYVGNLSISHSGGSQTTGAAFTRYCHIYYDWGGSSQKAIGACTEVASSTTTMTMTTSDTIKSNVLSVLGTTAYSSGKFYAVCWNQNSNGSRSSYTVKSFTININSDGGATPTLNAPTLSGGYTGYTSTCFVVGRHNVKVTSGGAATRRAPSGTTLSYKISCTGASDVSASSATFTGLTAGKKTITVTVTDSRGLSTTKTVYCRYQAWAKPTVTITKAERDSSDTTTINVEYSISYTPIYAYSADADTAGTQLNSIITQYYTTSETYTACTSPFTIEDTSNELSYTIKVRVGDKFNSSESDYGYASKTVGTINVYIASRSHGIGLNCVPESTYRLQVNGNAKFGDTNGNVTMVGGTLKTTGSITSASALISNGGAIELFGATPYIDFHYGSSTADYTSRLIANGESKLTCTSDFYANGSIYMAGTKVSIEGHTHSGYASSSHTHSYLPLSGGTLTGTLTSRTINPSATNTYNIGSTSAQFGNICAKVFIENGYNAFYMTTGNGWTAFRLSNGLLIQIKAATYSISSFNAWGNIYSYDVNDTTTYPISFVTEPVRHASIPLSGTSGNAWIGCFMNGNVNKLKQFGTFSFMRGTNLGGTYIAHLVAIGRWK